VGAERGLRQSMGTDKETIRYVEEFGYSCLMKEVNVCSKRSISRVSGNRDLGKENTVASAGSGGSGAGGRGSAGGAREERSP